MAPVRPDQGPGGSTEDDAAKAFDQAAAAPVLALGSP
jgi:hypothetical protein